MLAQPASSQDSAGNGDPNFSRRVLTRSVTRPRIDSRRMYFVQDPRVFQSVGSP
jgi:hypothetical protein